MSNDKISVIVPVYNAEKYLDQGITSLIGQTHHNLEIILIDDCSTDRSLSILEKYAKKDQRIKLIKNTRNSGESFNRNVGLDAATGDYVAFMDADDWYEKDAMEVMLKAITEAGCPSGQTVFCISSFYHEENGQTAESFYAKTKNAVLPSCKEYLLEHPEVWFNLRYEVWSRLYRRDGFIKTHRFMPGIPLGPDGIFMLELEFNADKIIYVDKPLYHYRILDQSAYHGVSKQHACIVDFYRAWLTIFEKYGVIDRLRSIFFDFVRPNFVENLNLTPSELQDQLIQDMRSFIKELNYEIKCPSKTSLALKYLAYRLSSPINPLRKKLKHRYVDALELRQFLEIIASCHK